MKDIAEAKSLGIELNTLTLNELYASLRDARLQKIEFERRHPGKPFKYDSGDESQLPYHDDGLEALKTMIVEEHNDKETKRHASATPNRKRAR